MRIIALFNLKSGVTAERYEAWAKTTDMPAVRRLSSVSRFEVMRVTGLLGGGGAPPYAYAEIIDVADMGAFGEEVAGAVMQKVAAEFQEMADVTFLTTEPLADAAGA